MSPESMPTSSSVSPTLNLPRPRAILLGCALVILLAFLMPYVNLSLRKYDWAFRPLPTGPVFVLFVLIWPVNTLLRRRRPGWAFTGPELLLVYAMIAITAPIHYEGLYGYALDFSVYPQYAASPANRWAEMILPNAPPWLLVTQPEAVVWFFESAPAGARLPWGQWYTPVAAWSLFGLALYAFLFCLGCLVRKDWIEGERLTFPMAALPSEMAGDPRPTLSGSFYRNPFLWAGFALPAFHSLLQMAHAVAPAVPYSRMYFHVGRWFAGAGPWDSLSNSMAYISFDTIGIFGLLPLEISLSLWLFYLVNRAQILTFAALGYGQEAIGARLFSPSGFVAYQEAGAAIMFALLLLWRSRRSLAAAYGALVGRPSPRDPLAPISPLAAVFGLLLSGTILALWAHRAGVDLWVFGVAMAIFLLWSLSMARLVAASGIYVPDISMTPRSVMVGITGAAGYSARSLTVLTYVQGVFMMMWKLNFMHYSLNDMKITHSARLPGRVVAVALLMAVLLMMAVVPWVDLYHAYRHGALGFDLWLFRDAGAWQFGQLAGSLRAPEAPAPYLPLGLGLGAAIMYVLTWLHSRFIWWAISPIGFIMGGTWGLGQRMWASAFIAWVLVAVLRRFGGLRLYRRVRPVFLGMILGHLVIMGLRSLLDPVLGLQMHLAAWE